jgi:hypothetical protein
MVVVKMNNSTITTKEVDDEYEYYSDEDDESETESSEDQIPVSASMV